jgi:hypothetical protein
MNLLRHTLRSAFRRGTDSELERIAEVLDIQLLVRYRLGPGTRLVDHTPWLSRYYFSAR